MNLATVIGDMDLVRPLGRAGVQVATVTARPDAGKRPRLVGFLRSPEPLPWCSALASLLLHPS